MQTKFSTQLHKPLTSNLLFHSKIDFTAKGILLNLLLYNQKKKTDCLNLTYLCITFKCSKRESYAHLQYSQNIRKLQLQILLGYIWFLLITASLFCFFDKNSRMSNFWPDWKMTTQNWAENFRKALW